MKTYGALMVDPPWPEKGGGKRGAQHHYRVQRVVDLPGIISASPLWRPAANSHLYLWATTTHLPDGLRVMAALGFRYVNAVTWVKKRVGLGQYFRGQHELLLFGVRGDGYAAKTNDRTITNVITGSTGRVHSRKPDAAYELVESRSVGPHAELFSRRQRDGWDCWGDEL